MRTRRSAQQLEPDPAPLAARSMDKAVPVSLLRPKDEDIAHYPPVAPSSTPALGAHTIADGDFAARWSALPEPPAKLSRLVETAGPTVPGRMTSEDFAKLRNSTALRGQASSVASEGPSAAVLGRQGDRKRRFPDTLSLPTNLGQVSQQQQQQEQLQEEADLQPPPKQRKCVSLPAANSEQQQQLEESPFAASAALDYPGPEAAPKPSTTLGIARDDSALLIDTRALGLYDDDIFGAGSGTLSGAGSCALLPPIPRASFSNDLGSVLGSSAVRPAASAATAPANNQEPGSALGNRANSMDWAMGHEVLTSFNDAVKQCVPELAECFRELQQQEQLEEGS